MENMWKIVATYIALFCPMPFTYRTMESNDHGYTGYILKGLLYRLDIPAYIAQKDLSY